MKLYIKYMVSNRCKIMVKDVLKGMGLHFIMVNLGEVEIMENLSPVQLQILKQELSDIGLELMDDKKSVLIERVKSLIIDMVHNSEEMIKTNVSDYLSKKLEHHYTYISNLFSEVQGTTIEHFIIAHKVERIKELIMYGELNLTEISYKMNYSSVAHLSNQFKKVTGFSPSHYKQLKDKRRNALEEVGVEEDAN
ncbi:MAG: helix-turn-helix transcriptional regulator [Chitinophagales bacterium]|nr:helix-turn-helix transcriptional regulator [Chitinophagales bacterium]